MIIKGKKKTTIIKTKKEYGKSVRELRARLNISKDQMSLECCNCKSNLSFRLFEIDHIIPLCLNGGTEEDNLQHLCKKCHNAKSGVDKRILYIFKELGLIEKIFCNQWTTYVSVSKLHELYLDFFPFVKEKQQRDWYG